MSALWPEAPLEALLGSSFLRLLIGCGLLLRPPGSQWDFCRLGRGVRGSAAVVFSREPLTAPGAVKKNVLGKQKEKDAANISEF